MEKKKFNITKEKGFQIINTLLIVGILSFYMSRLLYFKKKVYNIYSNSSYSFLSKVLVDRIDYSSADRLIENEDGTYTFVGNVNNNYISISGNLYRIISIDSNKNIKIIAEKSITIMPLYEKDIFYNTSISHWLNQSEQEHTGLYERIVKNESYLVENSNCVCQIDNLEEHICTQDLDLNKFGLLSLKEYQAAGGQNSYLNNGERFWLCNRNSENKYYLVNNEGAIGLAFSQSLIIGVRPVLTLCSTTIARSGDGTKENPFTLLQTEIKKVLDAPVGAYIQYADMKWQVESIDENRNVILIMDGIIQQDDDNSPIKFGAYNYITLDSGVGYYLNNEFLEKLEKYEDYLVLKKWTYGTFPYIGEYDYRNSCYGNEIECYVSIPNISFKHLKGNENIYIANNGTQSDELICVIDENLIKFIDINETANVKPVICLNGQILITSGAGTEDDPFVLEVIDND